MKTMMKNLLLSTLFLFYSSTFIFAQGVPNGNFEMWNKIQLFEQPDGYLTTNQQSFFLLQTFNVTKSTDAYSGDYAIKLETIANANDTLFGFAMNGDPQNALSGGHPFTSKPDSVKIQVKSDIKAGDTAIIFILFKKFGITLGMEMYYVTGKYSSYTELSFPIKTLIANPDSILFGIASGNPDGNPIPGTWIMLDDVEFTNSTSNLHNKGFEDWTEVGYDEPFGWFTMNSYFLLGGGQAYANKSTDAYEGNFALAITTTESEVIGNNEPFGIVTTGYFVNDDLGGGFPLNKKPDSISFYYKYDNSNNTNDSALFYIHFSKFSTTQNKSIVVDSHMIFLPSTFSYQYHSIPFDLSIYDIDSSNIVLGSSNFFNEKNIGIGNKLFIDDIEFYYEGVGFPLTSLIENKINIYPNPADNFVNIETNNIEKAQIITTNIYDIEGRLMLSKKSQIQKGTNNINLSTKNIPNGQYLIRLIAKNQTLSTKKLIIKH